VPPDRASAAKARPSAAKAVDRPSAARVADRPSAARIADRPSAAKAVDRPSAARVADRPSAAKATRPGAATAPAGPEPRRSRPARTATGKSSPPPRARLEMAPRTHQSVVPSIPIPVKAVARKPTIEQRSRRIEQRLGRQDPEFRLRYDQNLDMSWIYHDTALEGVVYTFEELASALRGVVPAAGDSSALPTYEAIRRNKEAIEFVKDLAQKKRQPFTVDTVRRIYTILHPEEGDVKTVKYRKDIPQHRLYFHEYAAPDKIAYKVRQAIDWALDPETRRTVNILRIGAKVHYDLCRAYPFPVDSGKVARLFMNVILLRAGLPAAIIHATERQRYYEALKAPAPSAIVQMLRDAVENSLASIEKLLDEHETNTRGFVT
ncbi:MAG: Fic family protein, partial [Polyangiaceae bacterium]|nr:Fic family protein [Polyangiaceae bacterium]